MDDILIYFASKKEHEKHLRIVSQILRDNKLYAKYLKCESWIKEVKFLGHIVSADGIAIDPSKIKAVIVWQRPKSIFEIYNFLGLTGYYQRFVKDFSKLAGPLTKLTQKE